VDEVLRRVHDLQPDPSASTNAMCWLSSLEPLTYVKMIRPSDVDDGCVATALTRPEVRDLLYCEIADQHTAIAGPWWFHSKRRTKSRGSVRDDTLKLNS
jgi:hypothetical protein